MLISEQMKQIEKFSNNECIIIDFIKKLNINIQSYSARQIAKETFTSPSTVVRLCKKFKYVSFQEFKDAYISELKYLNQSNQNINNSIPFTKDNSYFEISNNLSILNKEVADNTIQSLKQSELEKAIQFIEDSKHIYIFSSGVSINLAKIFQEQMMKIGYDVVIYDSLDLQFIKSMNCGHDDCFILMSYTGETTRILQLARNLKRNKAKIISITSLGNNHLSSLSSCILHMSSNEKILSHLSDFSTMISMNLILNILYSCLFKNNFDKNYQKKLELEKYREVQRQRDVQNNIK